MLPPIYSKDKERAEKGKVRPVMKKGELKFQLEVFRGRQAFHENLSGEEAAEKLLSYMENFRQMQMETATDFYTILVSKKSSLQRAITSLFRSSPIIRTSYFLRSCR